MTQPAAPAPQAGPPQGQPTPPVQPAPTATPPAAPPAPPWGTPEQFDAEKAWQLIQNLRGDVASQKARVAELTPFEQKAKELEDAAKTELQRAQDAAVAAQKTAADATLALLRHKVASRPDKPLPAVLVDVLQGSTEAELIAHADALLAGLPSAAAAAPVAPTGTTPVSALRPTTLPNPPAPDLNTLIAEAKAKGDIKTVIALENSKLATYKPNA